MVVESALSASVNHTSCSQRCSVRSLDPDMDNFIPKRHRTDELEILEKSELSCFSQPVRTSGLESVKPGSG